MANFIEIDDSFGYPKLLNVGVIESIEAYDKMFSNEVEHRISIQLINLAPPDYDNVSYVESYKSREDRDKRYEKLKKKLT